MRPAANNTGALQLLESARLDSSAEAIWDATTETKKWDGLS
jgi:hypothetical protein